MKKLLLPLLALTLLASCGNDNKSGKSSWSYTDPYLGGISGVPSYGSYSVQTVLDTVPCLSSNFGLGTVRQQMQQQLTGFSSTIPSGDMYVGITSYGDVGVLLGQGNNAPVFIAYLCPRNFTNYSGSTISNIKIATQTNCRFKPLVSAMVAFPATITYSSSVMASADFRMLDYGYYNGSSFTTISSVCNPTSP